MDITILELFQHFHNGNITLLTSYVESHKPIINENMIAEDFEKIHLPNNYDLLLINNYTQTRRWFSLKNYIPCIYSTVFYVNINIKYTCAEICFDLYHGRISFRTVNCIIDITKKNEIINKSVKKINKILPCIVLVENSIKHHTFRNIFILLKENFSINQIYCGYEHKMFLFKEKVNMIKAAIKD